MDRKPNPPGERSEKTEAHRERVHPRRGWSPFDDRLLLEGRESERRGWDLYPEDELLFPEGKIPGGGRAHEPKMVVDAAAAEVAECAVTGVTGPREREAMNEASWALKAAEFWMMA